MDPKTYLGGSRIAAVAGLSPWAGAFDVWAELKGLRVVRQNPKMLRGNLVERPILEHDYAPSHHFTLEFPGTLLHPAEPWRGATPDAIANGLIDVQMKLVGRRGWRDWGDDDEGPDGVPVYVYAQAQWEIDVIRAALGRDVRVAHVVALIGTDRPVYEVPYDPEFAENLVEVARDFWERHVLGDETPPTEGSESARDVLFARHPRHSAALLEADDEVERLARQYVELGRTVDEIRGHREAVGDAIGARIGDAEGVVGLGVKATWKRQEGSVSWARVARELEPPAELIEKHRGAPRRVLRVTAKEEEGR